jgi:hypothetical protein
MGAERSLMNKKPSAETLAACREYVNGRASAKKQSMWNEMGTWDPQRDDQGRLIGRPRDYWCPIVVIGKERKGVVGPNPDGSSGAPSGYLTREEAVASAERFLAKCREILSEAES